MRSKTASRLLSETSEETKNKVRNNTNKLINMTLEQIKNRQQIINDNLFDLSYNLSNLVDYLGGEDVKSESKTEEPQTSGLIGNIEDLQSSTERAISYMYSSYRKLYDQVYEPRVECAEELSQIKSR